MKRYTLIDHKRGNKTTHYSYIQFHGAFWVMYLFGILLGLML